MAGFNMDDYVPVNERIEAFYQKHPEGSLQSEIVEHTETRVTVKAYAYRDRDDQRPGTGLSSETIPGSTSFTKGSEVENAETSAWGRAIAALGFEVKRGIASREEMRRQQPERGERTQKREAQPPSRSAAPAPVRTPEEQAFLDELVALPGMSTARLSLLADAVGVPKGQRANADQLMAMLELATTSPDQSASAGASDPASGGGSSAPAAPTPSGEAATEQAGKVASPPGDTQPVPAPTLDDILAATGGELVPPKPGTDEYKALTAQEKVEARAWHQLHAEVVA